MKPTRILCVTQSMFALRAKSSIFRITTSRSPSLVSNVRTLHVAPNATSQLFHHVDAPASVRPSQDKHCQWLGHATFSTKQIMEALFGVFRQQTIVLITHRRSLLSYCDRVVELLGERGSERTLPQKEISAFSSFANPNFSTILPEALT